MTTATPRVKILQLTNPVTVVFKSLPNSVIRRTSAAPTPPIAHVHKRVNTRMVEKARLFFHAGQLRGSLISSEGCGIRTMSFLVLSRSASAISKVYRKMELPSTSLTVPSVASSSFKERNV